MQWRIAEVTPVANGGGETPPTYYVEGEPMIGTGSTEEPHQHPHDGETKSEGATGGE